jgi:hypothetical protein
MRQRAKKWGSERDGSRKEDTGQGVMNRIGSEECEEMEQRVKKRGRE